MRKNMIKTLKIIAEKIQNNYGAMGVAFINFGSFFVNFFRSYDKYNYYIFRFLGLHIIRISLANIRILIGRMLISRSGTKCYADLCSKGYHVSKNVFNDYEMDSVIKLISELENGVSKSGRDFKQDGATYHLVNIGEMLKLSIPTDIIEDIALYLGVVQVFDVSLWLHGVEDDLENIDKDINYLYHTDTFHHTVKGFLYLNKLKIEDGPFNYIESSHKLTLKRIMYELKNSIHFDGFQGYRAENYNEIYPDSQEIKFNAIGNRFIVADTFGFHRRGLRSVGGKRWSVYFSVRVNPFSFSGRATY